MKHILDIGCGQSKYSTEEEATVIGLDIQSLPGVDVLADMRQLPFSDAAFDVAYSSHTLEHVAKKDVDVMFKEWIRVLKPHGELRIVIPDLRWAAERVVRGEIDRDVMNVLYGGQDDEFDYHKNGFSEEMVVDLLRTHRFDWIKTYNIGYHLIIQAARQKPLWADECTYSPDSPKDTRRHTHESRQFPPGLIGMATSEVGRYSWITPTIMGLRIPAGTGYRQGTSTSVARNYNDIVIDFLANRTLRWLCLIEDDHMVPRDGLLRLLAHNKPVVSALYLKRLYPFEPCLFDKINETDGMCDWHFLQPGEHGLLETPHVPNGFVVIQREVLEAIEYPWFSYEGSTVKDQLNQDIMFSRKVTKAGFKMYVDLDMWIGHNAVMTVFPYRDAEGNWQTRIRSDIGDIMLPPSHILMPPQGTN